MHETIRCCITYTTFSRIHQLVFTSRSFFWRTTQPLCWHSFTFVPVIFPLHATFMTNWWVREEWRSILEFGGDPPHLELTEWSTRYEFALQQSANFDGFRRLLRESVKRLHTTLVDRMEKEANRVQFFKGALSMTCRILLGIPYR